MKLKTIYQKLILEKIRSSEAHRDESSIQTVIDNKRGLGFIPLRGATISDEEFWDKVKKYKLNTLKVPSSPYNTYIFYRDGYEDDAKELRDIAEKYGGFLSHEATKEETIRIGELLGYEDSDIEEFVSTRYK